MQRNGFIYGSIALVIGAIGVVLLSRGIAWDIPVSQHFFTSPCTLADTHGCWVFNKSDVQLSFWLHKVPNRSFILLALMLLGLLAIPRFAQYRLHITVLLASMIIGPGIVSVLKFFTGHFCPNQLAVFQGILGDASAAYRPRPLCFPASHPSPGFALIALAFAPIGWHWRSAGAVSGLMMGAILAYIQLARGEHYLSHVLASFIIALCTGIAIRMAIEWHRR